MMQSPSRRLRAAALAALATTLGACADPTAPAPAAPSAETTTIVALLECPSSLTQSTVVAIIPLLGGYIAVGGTSIKIPAGAIKWSLLPVLVTITVPASQYMEVDIRVGLAEHYQFLKPVTITVDYGRCSGTAGDEPLTAWYIDSATKELLQSMGGVDDKVNHRVSFQTDHLSGYALATSRSDVLTTPAE